MTIVFNFEGMSEDELTQRERWLLTMIALLLTIAPSESRCTVLLTLLMQEVGPGALRG